MKPLLTPKTRNQYKTVLDGRTFTVADDEKIALVELKRGEDPNVYTRAEFIENVDKYSKGLINAGVKQGQIVLIALDGLAKTSFCFWGVIKLGATPLVYPTRSPKMLADVY